MSKRIDKAIRRRESAFAQVLAVLAVLGAALTVPAAAADGPGPVAGSFIVVYRAGVDADRLAERLQAPLGIEPRFEYRHAIQGFAADLTAAQLTAVEQDPDVAYATPDGPTQAFTFTPLMPGEKVPTGALRVGAATVDTVQRPGRNVAVVDTGVDLSHPDLNVVDGVDCIAPGTSAKDENGHGTLVSGVVGARNNGAGIVGVAPGTKLIAVRVSDANGDGTFSALICGIDWITAHKKAHKIRVANLSLGGAGSTDANCGADNGDALHAAVCSVVAAGVVVVAAAGNWSADLADTVPAAYPEVLTATAMSDYDGKAGDLKDSPICPARPGDDVYTWFSNYAVSAADRAHVVDAPGSCIRSTKRGGKYQYFSGTSAAAPHVAAAVAACMAHRGPCASKSPAQITTIIRTDAAAHANAQNGYQGDPHTPVAGQYYGYLVWVGGY